MLLSSSFRSLFHLAIVVLITGSTAVPMAAQPASGQRSAPKVTPAPHIPGQNSLHAGRNQEHLAQWMDRHSNLPLPQQQRALQNEPGFHDLPAQTQQRMLNHLSQLNSMPPEQRRRILERNEALAHLTPAQRQQVRGAMQQLGGIPEDRRRLVARAFRDLREMPQAQRQTILSSDRFRGQFSDEERNTLSSLLAVEPYLPVQRPNEGTEFGK